MHGREHLAVISPVEKKGLLLNVIRYENELRKADKYFADLESVKFDPELVSLASELVARNSAPFHPKQFKDTYAEELRKLVDKKAKGQKIEIPKTSKSRITAAWFSNCLSDASCFLRSASARNVDSPCF